MKLTPNETLAATVLAMLDAGEVYRKTRTPDDLRKLRGLEIKTKKLAHDILHPVQKQGNLFQEAMADVPKHKEVRKQVGQIDPYDPFAPPEPVNTPEPTWEFDGELPPSDTEYP
jgi:hypothetical protein